VFSLRDEFGQWDRATSGPSCGGLYNARVHPGEHVRVFPISNWTELDVWQYIARERLDVPRSTTPIAARSCAAAACSSGDADHAAARGRDGGRGLGALPHGGDISCTCPVESDAFDTETIIEETRIARLTERGATRMDDQTSEASMEKRKKEGYF